MTTLHEQIINDMHTSIREKNTAVTASLRILVTALSVYTKKKGVKNIVNDIITDDNATIKVVEEQLKMNKQEQEANQDAANKATSDDIKQLREDKVKSLQKEIELLQKYLPVQLTENEVIAIITSTIKEVGATSKADMGKLMPVLMPKVQGKFDGKAVNALVSKQLS